MTDKFDSTPTLDTLLNHRSIRKFTDEAISEPMLTAILQAGQAASTSSFLQAVSVIRITDPKKRQQLRQIASGLSADAYKTALDEGKRVGHGYVEECAEFLVFCMDSHRHHALAPDAQLDWTEVSLIGAIDTAIFAQNVLAAAESLGLGGVYIGGIRNDITATTDILALPRYVVPLFGMCLGHPNWEHPVNNSIRPRLPLDAILSTNTYTPASSDVLDNYDEVVKDYYKTRRLDLTWREQIKATFGEPVRPFVLEYMQSQGFNKR